MFKKIYKVNLYYICLLIILHINSLWYYISPFQKIFKYSVILEAFIIIILSMKAYKNHSKIVLIYVFFVCLYFSLLILNFLPYYNFLIEFLFVSLIVFYCYFNKINILSYISNVIIIIATLSIILYILFSIINIANPTSYYEIFNNKVIYKSYHNIYFTSQSIIINGFNITKNGFIFTEPGALCLYLNFSLIYELFSKRLYHKFKICILILAIISTISTFGYNILLCSIIAKTLLNYKNLNYLKKIFYSIFILLLLVTSIFAIYYISSDKLNSVSVVVRRDDAAIGFNLFRQKPIMGWGYNNYNKFTSMQNEFYRQGDIGGHSNGVINIIYTGGIYLLMFYIFGIYKFTKNYLNFNVGTGIILIIYLILQLIEFPCQNTFFIYTFISLGIFNYKYSFKIKSS